MTTRKLLILAIILSLITAGCVYFYFYNLERSLDDRQYISVIVADKDIAENTKITADMLREKEIPQEYVHERTVLDSSEAVGSITKVPLTAGEIVFNTHFAKKDEPREGLSYMIPENKRAVSVSVSEVSAVSHLILPGDKVDVLVTLDAEGHTQTSYALQNKTVLSIGREMERKSGGSAEYSTVTLAVSPQEAPNLVLASDRGSIRLLMRSPVDERILDIPAVRVSDI